MAKQPTEESKALVPMTPRRIEARDIFAEQMGMAKMFVESGCYPDCKTPAQAFVKIKTGVELGMTETAAMRQIHIIPKKGGGFTPALAADLLVGLVKRRGQAHFSYERDLEQGSVSVHAKRLDTNEEFSTTWDRERVAQTGISKSKTGIKDNWRHFEIEMMKHRADAEVVRALWPDVTAGLYALEELPTIDVEVVELPATRTEGLKQALGVPPATTPAEEVREAETILDAEEPPTELILDEDLVQGEAGAPLSEPVGGEEPSSADATEPAPEEPPPTVEESSVVLREEIEKLAEAHPEVAKAVAKSRTISVDELTDPEWTVKELESLWDDMIALVKEEGA